VDLGVHRLVLSHGGARPDLTFLAEMARTTRAEIFVAGVSWISISIRGLRDASHRRHHPRRTAPVGSR